jgi:hypothetical protein
MKRFIVLVAVLVTTGNLFAQTIVPHIGFTLSGSSYKPVDFAEKHNQKPVVGFMIGVGYDRFINDRFSIQPEFNFVQKGHISEDVAYPDGYEYILKSEYRYNYLEIPVLAKMKFGGVTKFYITAGPSVGIGLGGKHKFNSTFGGLPAENFDSKIHFSEKPTDYNGNDVYVDKRFDVGVQVGVGALLFGKATLNLRYTQGLTDLHQDFKSKNSVVQLSAGVLLTKF